ncbi:MAG: GNAT family protein, partial [Nanoarchaeota archaeon]
KTKGILLRPMRMSDVDDYCACRLEQSAQSGFLGIIKTQEEAKKNLQRMLKDAHKKKPGRELFAIIVENKYVGFVDLHDLHQKYFEHKATIGYCVHTSYRGQGIATAAVRAVTQYAFKKYRLRRIEGWCRTYNKASARVLEKAGYKLEGILRKHKCKDGKFLDDMVWAYVR